MDSQEFQYEFQRVSSCSAWCCYCSRRRDTQMRPQESVQSESQFSDQPLHGLHSKLQSNTMNIEEFSAKHAMHKKMFKLVSEVVFQGRCTLMHIIHMTSHALSCFENLLTDFTLQARMCYVECFNMPRHVTLKFELLATVKAPPHRPTRDVHHSCHVWHDQGIKIVKPCKHMSRQKTEP